MMTPRGLALSDWRFDKYVPFIDIARQDRSDLRSQPRILEISRRPHANENIAAGLEQLEVEDRARAHHNRQRAGYRPESLGRSIPSRSVSCVHWRAAAGNLAASNLPADAKSLTLSRLKDKDETQFIPVPTSDEKLTARKVSRVLASSTRPRPPGSRK
jgi:hypothetical protein